MFTSLSVSIFFKLKHFYYHKLQVFSMASSYTSKIACGYDMKNQEKKKKKGKKKMDLISVNVKLQELLTW